MLALLAGTCELVVLHIQVRREAHAISLSEIATVIGLFFATATDFVIGRAVGTLLAFVLWRRQSLVKSSFNAALFFAESTLALLVFHSVRGSDAQLDPRDWLGADAATVTAGLLAPRAVTAVIALVDGEVHRRDFVVEPLRGTMTSSFVTVVALVGVHALAQGPMAGVPLAVAMVLLLLGYRAYSALSERHLSLERLYRFSHAVSSSPEVDEILTGVLQHAREVLRAEYAEVIFVSSDSEHQPLRVDTDGAGGKLRRTRLSERDAAEEVWATVIRGGPPLLMPRGGRVGRRFLAHR